VGAVESLVLLADDDGCVPRAEAEKMKEIRAARREDPELVVLCDYLERGVLPLDEGMAKKVILESKRHEVIEGVLHFEPVAFPGK